ncbi:MAG: TonB-dependent receptor plug domain-containing protein [Treponema sp.]|jgi:iron complex outermembrane receptor protein|nr:TonB-dependent receptor plug domain-containing protein [Treponema sp.]
MKVIASIFAALMLFFAPALYAQEEAVEEAIDDTVLIMEGEGLTLEEDRALSPALPQVDEYGGRRNVVTEEDIQEQGSLDLLDALRNVPGVMFSKRNSVGTNTGTSLYVRGRGYTHPSLDTTVSFDGVPRFGLIYGQTMADSISVFTVGSIEVFKSPTPSSFGAGYAVVNVVPKYQRKQGWSAEGGFSGGSFYTFGENTAFGFKKGPFDIYGGQSFVSTEGHVVHSGAYQQSYYLNTGYWINAYWDLRAIFNVTDSETLQAPAIGQSRDDILSTYKTDTFFITLTLNNEYDNAKGLLKLYYHYTDFNWLDDNPQVEGDYSTQLLRGSGFRGRETFSILKGSITVGTDLDINLIANEDHNTARPSVITHFPLSTLFSPYAAASYTFRPGADFYIIPQGAFRGFVHSVWDNAVSPQAGITAGWRYLEIAGFYSHGVIYPAPGTIQSLINAGGIDGADLSKARPETVHHLEGNFSFTWETFALNLAYYSDDGKNRIVSSGTDVPGNVTSAAYFKIEGFEAGGRLKIGRKGFFPGGLEISGSGSWITRIRARGETGPEVDSMPYTPFFSATAAFTWEAAGGFRLSGDYQCLHTIYGGGLQNNASFTPISESRRLPDIHLVNLRLSYSFAHEPWRLSSAEMYVQANNVLDRKYEYYQGYQMPGFTFTLGGSFAFSGR